MFCHDSCIYKIQNKTNGKTYIGQTKDFYKRIQKHLSDLRRGKAANKHLQRAFNKYGENNFEFSIVEKCPIESLDEREQYWILKTNSCVDGYNMNIGGSGFRGFHMPEETKRKISQSNKGRIVSEKSRRKMRENHADISGKNHPFYGKKWVDFISPEAQERVRQCTSERFKGEKNPWFGIPKTQEQKENLSRKMKEWYKTHDNPLLGKERPDMQGANAPDAHGVMCLNTMKKYDCIKYAVQDTGISQPQLSQCCDQPDMGAKKDALGRPTVWVSLDKVQNFTDEDLKNLLCERLNNISERKRLANAKSIKCITTGELFDSMKSACEKYHMDPSSLSGHLNKRKCLNGCGRHSVTNELLKWERI